MSGALTVVPGVHLSDFSARAKCLFEGGKGEGGRPGLTGDIFFDRDGFSFVVVVVLYLFEVLYLQKKKSVWEIG